MRRIFAAFIFWLPLPGTVSSVVMVSIAKGNIPAAIQYFWFNYRNYYHATLAGIIL
jgi:predicted Na+-dependent transporter